MPKRKLNVISIVALVVVCLVGYFGFTEYSERKFDHTPRMLEFFKSNRANLDELAKMAATEPKILRVDLAHAYPESLPSQKIQEIRKRLKKLNLLVVETVSPEIRLVGGEYKRLRIGKYTGAYIYGYVYRLESPKRTFTTLNDITPRDGIGLVPIEGNWYLCGYFEE